MTLEELQNEIYYALSKQMLKKLLFRKLITQNQFEKIDKLNIKSFKPHGKYVI